MDKQHFKLIFWTALTRLCVKSRFQNVSSRSPHLLHVFVLKKENIWVFSVTPPSKIMVVPAAIVNWRSTRIVLEALNNLYRNKDRLKGTTTEDIEIARLCFQGTVRVTREVKRTQRSAREHVGFSSFVVCLNSIY